jgi:hypothetical protein
MLVVGDDFPAAMRPFAMSVVDAIRALQTPRAPAPVFACARSQLPPAEDWPNGVAQITEIDILAVSNGVAWIRQDTGAPI